MPHCCRKWLKTGWSNFSTLVGHFSKLFEFAGLNRLKTLIFVPNSGCSLKKKVFNWNRSPKFLFSSQIRVFSKKKGLQLESISEIPVLVPNSGCSVKKKKSSIGIDLRNSYFRPKIIAFSKKKVAAACNRQDLCKIVPQAAQIPSTGP